MLTFDLFRIPIRVQMFFWLLAFYISGGFRIKDADDWSFVLAKVSIVFVSILVHELGHAFASRYWGGKPMIELHGIGGVTLLGGWHFTRWQHLVITCAGPCASLLMAVLCFCLWIYSRPLEKIGEFGMEANIWWTVLNLLPILPMDGGQILRDLIGPRYEKAARMIGTVAALAVGLYFLKTDNLMGAVVMGFFAWQNFKGSLQNAGVQ